MLVESARRGKMAWWRARQPPHQSAPVWHRSSPPEKNRPRRPRSSHLNAYLWGFAPCPVTFSVPVETVSTRLYLPTATSSYVPPNPLCTIFANINCRQVDQNSNGPWRINKRWKNSTPTHRSLHSTPPHKNRCCHKSAQTGSSGERSKTTARKVIVAEWPKTGQDTNWLSLRVIAPERYFIFSSELFLRSSRLARSIDLAHSTKFWSKFCHT